VSEIVPLEIRAMAIALFYALATGVGGIAGPAIFGALVASKDPATLAWGFAGAASLMVVAGVGEAVIGVPAEQESLEDVAEPLSAEGGSAGEPGGEKDREPRRRPRAGTRTFWSEYPLVPATTGQDKALDRELELIEQALGESPLDRQTLARRVHARLWGPGRFRQALRVALAEGRVRRRGRLLHGAGSDTSDARRPAEPGLSTAR
jgi:hypothetical protein